MQAKPSYKETLFQILTIIGYQNDKEKFVTEFEMLNRFDAIANSIEAYPIDFQKKIKACQSAEEMRQFISIEEYTNAYIKTSQETLEAFIKSIENTLSLNQKQKIMYLIQS